MQMPQAIDNTSLEFKREFDEHLIAGIERAREIGNAGALSKFAEREIHPGPVRGQELEDFRRNGLVTFWHQSCTTKMGQDPDSAVDAQLRVYEIDGLHIADASVLPRVTRGNTIAQCVVIGERAAGFLKSAHGHGR